MYLMDAVQVGKKVRLVRMSCIDEENTIRQ